MVFFLELSAIDDLAAEHAASLLDAYLETLLGRGLLSFRIGRATTDPKRLMIHEEWTSIAAHEAHDGNPALAEMFQNLKPLISAPASGTHYEIVAAGFTDEDD